MAGSYLPLATAVVAILVATSAVPVATAAAATADKYSGRMVIIRAPGARVLDVSAGSALNKWQQRRRRLVEDEVAPEFGGLQLGAGNGGSSVSNDALNKDGQVCLPSGQCTKPGGPYTRGCTYGEKCAH
jgi:hypothetical protein